MQLFLHSFSRGLSSIFCFVLLFSFIFEMSKNTAKDSLIHILPAKIFIFINLFLLVHFKLIESQFTYYVRCFRQHGSQSTTSKASDRIFISILAFLLPCIRANTQLYPEGNINFKKIQTSKKTVRLWYVVIFRHQSSRIEHVT